MKSERGIFILSILRKLFDKLIYRDKYEAIANGISDSNIGAQKKKNIKNHLFEEKSCIYITIYDLVQCFDGLWLADCMNNLYDNLPVEQQDEKLALMYEANVHAVGHTEKRYSRVGSLGL